MIRFVPMAGRLLAYSAVFSCCSGFLLLGTTCAGRPPNVFSWMPYRSADVVVDIDSLDNLAAVDVNHSSNAPYDRLGAITSALSAWGEQSGGLFTYNFKGNVGGGPVYDNPIASGISLFADCSLGGGVVPANAFIYANKFVPHPSLSSTTAWTFPYLCIQTGTVRGFAIEIESTLDIPFSSNPNGSEGTGAVDLQAVVTHELGHGLGLAHNWVSGPGGQEVELIPDWAKGIARAVVPIEPTVALTGLPVWVVSGNGGDPPCGGALGADRSQGDFATMCRFTPNNTSVQRRLQSDDFQGLTSLYPGATPFSISVPTNSNPTAANCKDSPAVVYPLSGRRVTLIISGSVKEFFHQDAGFVPFATTYLKNWDPRCGFRLHVCASHDSSRAFTGFTSECDGGSRSGPQESDYIKDAFDFIDLAQVTDVQVNAEYIYE